MKSNLKMARTIFRYFLRKMKILKALVNWVTDRKKNPTPHWVKERVIKKYASRYGSRFLVETGTYEGEMIEAMVGRFERIYSIELSEQYFFRAKAKFEKRRDIEILQGDSSIELGKIIKNLKEPTLFWLDAHYSGGNTARGERDTPIEKEIEVVCKNLEAKKFVILIDDARYFGVDENYPSIEKLKDLVNLSGKNAIVHIKNDIIRITCR
jgi:hypothetical protein